MNTLNASARVREQDQANIAVISQRAELAQMGAAMWSAEFSWRIADNSYLPLTPNQMLDMATAANDRMLVLRPDGLAADTDGSVRPVGREGSQ